MADDGEAKPTIPDRARGAPRARVPADTDPVPLSTIADAESARDGDRPEIRYWPGIEIARGGMGRVIEATDTRLGRTVALKEALSTNPEALRRFARETKITALLEHPSIVPVYDAGTSPEGTPYYVMRMVTGRPLDELVKAATELRGRLVLLPHVVAATQALAHAHERGVIHRDVKPSNILVGNLGETVVIDWGLAKVTGEADDEVPAGPAPMSGDSLRTRVGTVFGTPGFMSPEQLRSSDVDARADVYALGATLYFVLAREPPHAAATGDAMMEAAAAGPPVRVDSLVRGVPAALATIVDKALAFDDRERYPHAGALAEDLTRFLSGQLVASHRYSAGERIRRFVRLHRVAVIAVVAAVVALAIGAVLAVTRVVDARDEAMAQADEADRARHRETERADDLLLSEAHLVLDRDPTTAIAMVRPLASGPRWREVHALAAEAEATGVAWRLPTSPTTAAIAMSPGGTRGASLGRDGVLRLYDLPAHGTRVLNVASGSARMPLRDDDGRDLTFVDDNHLVLSTSRELSVLDLTTDGRASFVLEAPGHGYVARRGVLFWVDTQGRGWRLQPGGAPVALAIDDDVRVLVPSPDGSRIAACSTHGLWLVSAGPAKKLVDGAAFAAAWDDGGQRLVVATANELVDLALATHEETRTTLTNGRDALQIADGIVYSASLGHVYGNGKPLAVPETGDFDLYRAGATSVVVIGGAELNLVVVDRQQRLELHPPAHGIQAVATSEGSRRVLALVAHGLYAWDLDAILPRVSPFVHSGVSIGTVGAHDVLVTSMRESHWLDLETGATTAAPIDGVITRLLDSPDGQQEVLVNVDDEAVVLRRGANELAPLAKGVATAGWLDATQVLTGGHDGHLTLHDLAHGTTRDLAAFEHDVESLRTSGSWVVAKSIEGELVRLDVAARAAPAVLHPGKFEGAPIVMRDGRVLFGDEALLSWWNLDGTVSPLVKLPGAVHDLFPIDAAHAVARDASQQGYLVDLAAGRFAPLDVMPLGFSKSVEAQVIGLSDDTGARVVDIASLATWHMARSWHGSSITLTRDGRYLFGLHDDGIASWKVPLPRSAEDTARRLDTLTNAHWDAASHELRW